MLEAIGPLRRFRLFESDDVEETQSRISEVMQPHRLRPIGPARRRSRMDFMKVRSIGIGAISFGRMGLDLDHVGDYHLMIFCRRGQARLRSGRQEFEATAQRGVCLAPGDPLNAEFSPDCEQVVMRIAAGAMRRHSGLKSPRLPAGIDLHDSAFAAWLAFLRGTLTNGDLVQLLASDPQVSADYEAMFYSTLLAGSAVAGKDGGMLAPAPATVRRAEAFIDANYASPLTLDDVASAAGVPVRTLLEGFRRFRPDSPMRYLRNRRLDAARQLLLARRSGERTISVAMDVGFGHYGRFAAAYFQRFGEKPSDTSRR